MSSLIFFLIALYWFLRGSRKPHWDPLDPARLYGTVWFAAICVTTMYLSDLQMRWTLLSWICILGSVLAYLAGVWLAGKPTMLGASAGVYATVIDVLEPKRFMTAVKYLYLVCLGGYVWRIHSAGSIPALADNVEETRWRFYDIENGTTIDKVTANLAFLFSAVVITCALSYILRNRGFKKSRRTELSTFLLLGSALLFLISTTFRGAILPPLVVVAALYHYLRRNFRVWTLALALLATVSAALGLVVYRHLSSASYNLQTAYTLAEMRIPPEYALFAEPYTYVALSFDNIVKVFERPLQPTLGILTFRPLWTILGLKRMLLEDVNLPFLPAYGFNTATYLFPFYEDFGILGVLLFPFFFGWVSGKLYSAMQTSGRLVHAVAYSFVVMLILFSVLDNLFVFMRFWVELGLLFAVLYISRAKAPSSVNRVLPAKALAMGPSGANSN